MRKTKENGITLIALVVTIIVLLILAGITISLVVGQNGIITRANEAKEKQAIATEKEQLEMAQMAVKTIKFSKGDMTAMTAAELNTELAAEGIKATASGANPIIVTFTESNRKYEVTDEGETSGSINWDEILDNATKPHPDQKESGDIAIGTDGELVNLDLWRYRKEEDNVSYGLHGNPSSSNYDNGYIGEYVNGKIIGKVPQYIKEENGEFLPVTSMSHTFYGGGGLITAPAIPSTVVNMNNTFYGCSLIVAPTIPEGVTSMQYTFYNCSSLTTAPVLPRGVKDMYYTFYGCSNLTTAPVIPSTVINMGFTFSNCSNLNGELVINAEPTYYDYCLLKTSTSANANLKLTGTSTILNKILATKSANSNISIK